MSLRLRTVARGADCTNRRRTAFTPTSQVTASLSAPRLESLEPHELAGTHAHLRRKRRRATLPTLKPSSLTVPTSELRTNAAPLLPKLTMTAAPLLPKPRLAPLQGTAEAEAPTSSHANALSSELRTQRLATHSPPTGLDSTSGLLSESYAQETTLQWNVSCASSISDGGTRLLRPCSVRSGLLASATA